MLKKIAATIATTALILSAPLIASAQDAAYRKLTYLTFSAPIQLPGFELPAGTYRFSLADPDTSRRVIEVQSQDGKEQYGMFLSIPDQKLKQSGDPVVLFRETPAGQAPAVKAWFYPSETTGHEFVYPKDQAVNLAKATHERVLSTDTDYKTTERTERVKTVHGAKVHRIDESGTLSDDVTATSGTIEQKESKTDKDGKDDKDR